MASITFQQLTLTNPAKGTERTYYSGWPIQVNVGDGCYASVTLYFSFGSELAWPYSSIYIIRPDNTQANSQGMYIGSSQAYSCSTGTLNMQGTWKVTGNLGTSITTRWNAFSVVLIQEFSNMVITSFAKA